MIRYRIYTEGGPKYRLNIIRLCSQYLPGFTIFEGTGYWAGASEESAVIEYIGSPDMAGRIRSLVYDIRYANDQQSVLVTAETLESVEYCGK